MSQNIDIPSNAKLISKLDKEIERLDEVEHDPAVGYQGERILDDLKRVINDEKVLIETKNAGENVQHLAEHSYLMAMDLINDERFGELFENWGSILASAARSGAWSDITAAVGSLATDLRQTESFIKLLSELQATIKLLLAQRLEQAASAGSSLANQAASAVESASQGAENVGLIEKDTKHKATSKADVAASKGEELADKARSGIHKAAGLSNSSAPIPDSVYQAKKEKQRKKLLKQLDDSLRSLSRNPTWCMLISKTKAAGKFAKEEAVQPAAEALTVIAENPRVQQVVDDFKATLQGLVGPDVSVQPFFDHTFRAINCVVSDAEYPQLFAEIQDQLGFIAERPILLDDDYTHQNLQNLWSRLEAKLEALRSNPDILASRRESEKLLKIIKNDPASAKLINDCQKLLFHLRSLSPGHPLDPALLSEMRGLLVPLLLEHLTEVPVPGLIDTTDNALGKFEYRLDNIHISAKELVPENIHIKFKYDLDAHPLSLSTNNQHLVILLKAKGIQVHLKDVAWTYQRLSSPHLHDSGHADLQTQGKGVSVRLRMEVNTLSETHENPASGQLVHNKEIFRVIDSCCHIDRWSIEFRDSKHDTLYEMLSSLFSSRIKKHIEELVIGKMRAFAEVFNHRVYVLYNEARLKQKELGFLAESKKSEALDNWEEAKHGIKDALLHSAAAEALKDAAIEKGKEAIKVGFQQVKEAPSLGAAISGTVSDITSKVRDSLEDSDLVGDLAKKADKSSEYEDKSDYHRVRSEYAPVPATSFVSSDPKESSALGDIPPQKKDYTERSAESAKTFSPSQ